MIPGPLPGLGQATHPDFDSARWMIDHTALVKEATGEPRETRLRRSTPRTRISSGSREQQQPWPGSPDLIAVKGKDLVVIDAKDGQAQPPPQHPGHDLPCTRSLRAKLEFSTGAWSSGATSSIPDGKNVQHSGISGVDRKFIDRLGALIRRLADETPARKVPSASECRWCDITLPRTARSGRRLKPSNGRYHRRLLERRR